MKILLDKEVLVGLNDSEKEAINELKDLIESIETKKLQMNLASITPQNVDQAIAVLRTLNEEYRRKVTAALSATLSDENES